MNPSDAVSLFTLDKRIILSAGDKLNALASCKTFVSRSSHETQRKKRQRQPRGGIEPPSMPDKGNARYLRLAFSRTSANRNIG